MNGLWSIIMYINSGGKSRFTPNKAVDETISFVSDRGLMFAAYCRAYYCAYGRRWSPVVACGRLWSPVVAGGRRWSPTGRL